MLHIPLFSYPQRGALGLGYSVQLNSKNWEVAQYTGASQSQHYRWRLSGQPGLFLTSSYDVQLRRVRTITTDVNGGQSYQDGNYAVRTPDGTVHWLSGVLPNGNMVTQDGSDFQFTLTPGTLFDHSNDSGALKARNGTVYHYSNLSRSRDFMTPLWGTSANVIAHVGEWRNTTMAEGNNTVQTFNDSVSPTSIVDANGNTMGFSFTVNPDGSTTVGPATDSNGQLIPFASGNLGATATAQDNCMPLSTISSAYLFNFSAPDSRVSPITLCYTAPTLAPVFSQPNVEAAANDATFKSYPVPLNAAASLAMPDGTKWAFAYDAYGNITTMNLPTGGVITYEWTEAPLPSCQDGNTTAVSRAVFKRKVNDPINPVQTWQYTWGTMQGDGSITNYVLDPNGNETAHVFKSPVANLPCALYETETRTYQGDHLTGTLLKTVDTHYTGSMNFNDTVSFPANVVADTITTTLPGNKISKIVRQYDGSANATFGKVIDEKVYDYGTGGPGLLLREMGSVSPAKTFRAMPSLITSLTI
jgi:YD repeat-containing protein